MFRPERNLVLAVDDENDFLDLIQQIGEGVGCEVITANSAQRFRDQLSQRQPALILLDLQMPGTDGIEALRYMARLKLGAGVVLVSGMDQRVLASARQLGEGLGLRMLGVIQKPAMIDEIERLLTEHVKPRRFSAAELRQAIDEHDLVVHYQPKLVLEHGEWMARSAEALVRWQHAQLGLILPGDFLPLAEETGMILDITDFVLTDALRQIGHWRRKGLEISAAVNLAPRLVQDLQFPDRLAALFREFDVEPSQLTFDVTEAAALVQPELVLDIFARLRVRGVGLALDDFGAGASSLTQLFKMPFSEIKIDRTVTCELGVTPAAATVMRAIVDLAHHLSLSACAEGVETREAFEFLQAIRCDALQGDFIAPPMPAAEIEGFIRAWNGGARSLKAG